MNLFEALTAEIREVNTANGWFDKTRGMGDDIALLHSEVSEMYEAYRVRGVEPYTQEIESIDTPFGKPDDFGSECADVLIRLLDTCDRYGIDLFAEYERKMLYNRTRGYKHGGKLV